MVKRPTFMTLLKETLLAGRWACPGLPHGERLASWLGDLLPVMAIGSDRWGCWGWGRGISAASEAAGLEGVGGVGSSGGETGRSGAGLAGLLASWGELACCWALGALLLLGCLAPPSCVLCCWGFLPAAADEARPSTVVLASA
jgi:hypothetical protein